MQSKPLHLALILALIAIGAGSASGQTAFLFQLDGGQEVPPIVTGANGLGLVVLDAAQTQITVNIYHSVASPTAAHIHSAPAGANGGIVINLGTPTSPITGTFPVSPSDVAALLAGTLYVNIHSPSFPAGEARGQIVNSFTPQVFISEFCCDPVDPSGVGLDTNLDGTAASFAEQSNDEFVEIVNGTDQTVDISGWMLSDGAALRHVFGAGTLMPPLGSVTVFGGGDLTNFNNIGLTGVVAGSGALGLNNTGDTITLADSLGGTIDTYTSSGASDGQSEARFPASPALPFVLHTSTPTGVLQSAGYSSDGLLIAWPPTFLPLATYPGTQEDLSQSTGINGSASGGPGNDIKTATGGDSFRIHLESPGGTFAGRPFLILGELFPTGLPPVGVLPTLHLSLGGFFILVNGATPVPPGLQPVLQTFGNTYDYVLPGGLAGSSLLIQSLALDPLAANGVFAITDAHEIQML